MTRSTQYIILHVVSWLIFALAIFYFSSQLYQNRPGSLFIYRFLLILPLLIAVFYINSTFLMPRFFEKKKYLKFFALIIVIAAIYIAISNIGGKIFMQELSTQKIISRNPPIGEENLRPPFRRIFLGKFFIDFFQVFTVLFASTVYRNIKYANIKDKHETEIEQAKMQADLKLLKAQINPHFLFNALNNIYSNILLKGSSAAESVYKLSHLLRYVIYDCKADFVPLEKEVDYLKSFVSLQQLKDEELMKVSFEVNGDIAGKTIAPMILIPFVENSFKHSSIENADNGWINIKLNLEGKNLSFLCENSIPLSELHKDDTKGIGIENVKKRLNLLYDGEHLLKICKQKEKFIVFLKININEGKMLDSR